MASASSFVGAGFHAPKQSFVWNMVKRMLPAPSFSNFLPSFQPLKMKMLFPAVGGDLPFFESSETICVCLPNSTGKFLHKKRVINSCSPSITLSTPMLRRSDASFLDLIPPPTCVFYTAILYDGTYYGTIQSFSFIAPVKVNEMATRRLHHLQRAATASGSSLKTRSVPGIPGSKKHTSYF